MGPKKKSENRGGAPKPGTKQAKAAAERSAETAKKAQTATDEQKKPSVKEVIGGASWTGKLPVNMLAEHCQKQKWEKPEYTMMKVSDGFVSSVILKRVDPKTRETIVLPPMKLPPSHKHLAAQPTALEARHFAAAYTLYRVCNMKNLHMMMPPTYKKLWREDFADLKTADCKEGKGWMYEADPFLAKLERESAAADLEKKRKEREKAQAAKAAETTVDLGLGSGTGGENKSRKIWSHAPKVDLGGKIRREIEGMLREHAIWNPYGVEIPQKERDAIVDELTRLGFRRSHVEEAVGTCKDREEVLEWLLIYVPEDDLPRWCLPEGYSAGVSLASDDLAREAKIKRLTSIGYPVDLCTRILDSKKGDEVAAAEVLQNTLVHGGDAPAEPVVSGEEDLWAEEQETLEAIFGERYSRVSGKVCEIKGENSDLPEALTFRFQRPSTHYPYSPPIVSIQAKGIPAYIRLSAIRQVVQYSEENFLGEPMIYNVLDWLETNLPSVMENPGKLRDISTVTAPLAPSGTISNIPVRSSHKRGNAVKWQPGAPQSISLRESWEARQSTKEQQEMLRKRQALPAWNTQQAIIDAVNTNQVTIISGETGSGKSTQSVQFLLDDLIKRDLGAVANIICTQPRRISALGLADRVSDERCTSVGEEVGYIIRGESKIKSGRTKITFVTTGVLLRRMQSGSGPDGNVASSLSDVTHVVVDEVHERSLDTDFLLALLRDVLHHRKDIKVILMSATLDADIFINYFGGRQSVGLVNIPGRTFPVDDYYLDDVIRDTGFYPEFTEREFDEEASPSAQSDEPLGKVLRSLGMGINYELIASTVRYIDAKLGDQPGGILIFLPGTMEIERCLNAVRRIPNAHPLPLHASLLPAEQRRVFLSAPKGMRKVIAATNVAETSITIEDIVAVIDTGRVKETSYDPRDNIVRLQEVWASQAACKQRRGRAGRVQAGTCYKLYTRKAETSMPHRPDPEIRRVPLEQLCLSVKAMQGINDVAHFLANTITPPESTAVEGALEFLHRVGALDHDRLTALGRYLSMIPADLRCAKLMVYGSIFGCIDACVTISAILTVKSPFVSPRDKRDEATAAKAAFTKGANDGDLLTDLLAYQQWSDRVQAHGYWQTQSWCTANFLSHQTLRDISSNRAQLLTSLKDAGLLPVDYASQQPQSSRPNNTSTWNRNTNNKPLLRALIAGAFQPQIAQISFPDKKFAASITGTVEIDPDARTIKYFNQENGRVFIHPSSLLFSAQNYPGGAAYLSYFTKMATSKVFVRDLTPFNAFSLLLFCGSINLDTTGRGLIVDGWLRLRGWARIGVLVSRLRMMLDEVIAGRIDQPAAASASASVAAGFGGVTGALAEQVIEVVKRLVEFNGLDQ
ncbi:RNA helicase [Aspergillus saccharolyticus JOP 1030-1]|uniref:P-loop containing nucleoside triphosphate hydrolase protein n=1 Tax=Aspergillus saccharolyticus JOP 1030-1 TaxID=1450539 RepID=A0A318ZJR3_9EURO|nr:P-loop containing nucleoside triphosphate hydrolase protein [Aspergillus saccharolyticus JOP 1030-1]PYH44010.1 P-loop containing nucleoside triphosphate hydrolase protein [Aspergillus saccharolyticus JOP 1030-1]